MRQFVEKANELLQQRIHLLIVDPFPPSKRDPFGIHAAIFERHEDDPYRLPPDKPLTVVAYECDARVRGYLEPIAVGDPLPDMPVYLRPGVFVEVSLETTYMAAWAAVPKRWRDVVAPP